jgi:sirohydrochlorin cobaltochelatase
VEIKYKKGGRDLKAVLFVGHGSKDAEGNEEVRRFVDEMSTNMKINMPEELLLETCFLEFESPNIQQGIEACVLKGATHVNVIPIILLPAGHSKIHIPAAIDEARVQYPHVQFTYGRPIGIHEETFDILATRLVESGLDLDAEHEDTAVLLVGRGSSDPDANSDLFKITRMLWERLNVKWVETAFMGVTSPLVDDGVQRCLKLGAKKVVILPYFLFTGILIKRMETMISHFQEEYPESQFILADYFGYHPKLQVILKDRVEEALRGNVQMNCDTCQYRLDAMEHIDHHHHHDHEHGHHHEGEHHHHHDHEHAPSHKEHSVQKVQTLEAKK